MSRTMGAEPVERTAGVRPESQTDVRLDGSAEVREGREATPGSGRAARPAHRREPLMVPKADFASYYGRPVLNQAPWQAPDIAGYLFLGGLAGASSTLAAVAELTGRRRLARACKTGAVCALGGSLYSLIHDLGKPERFLNMLRVFKVTSPMSVGTWILTAYGPQAAAAAADLTGRYPGAGRAATMGAALTGPALATYTAALICDTAVPAWHEGFREMPFLFAGSSMAAAGGLGMLAAPVAEAGPARRAAMLGAAAECVAAARMERRLGPLAEPLKRNRLLRLGEALTLGGALTGAIAGHYANRHNNRTGGGLGDRLGDRLKGGVGGRLGGGGARRSWRVVAMAAGAALLAGSACTRFGIFQAGMESADDPRYTIQPQRRRLAQRKAERDLG